MRLVFVLFVGSLFAGLSCGPSAEDERVAEAVARMANRKPPGYIRVLNLTPAKVGVFDRGRPVTADAPPGRATRLVPLGTGQRTIEVRGAKTFPVLVALTSREGTTVVLLPNGNIAHLGGDPLRPTGNTNVHVVTLDVQGNRKAKITAVAEGASSRVELNQEDLYLAPGKYRILGYEAEIAPKIAYTLVLLSNGAKQTAYLLQNTGDEAPMGAKASAS
jgi:hypothetical protein